MRPLVLALIATLLSAPAGAVLIPVDVLAPGDQLAVYDTSTGLRWLKPSATAGLSGDQVVLEDAGDWYSTGWRHATTLEFCGLVFPAMGLGAGCEPLEELSPGTLFASVPGDVATAFFEAFDVPSKILFAGREGGILPADTHYYTLFSRLAYNTISDETQVTVVLPFSGNRTYVQTYGHWLVLVPEPGTALLLGIGLAAIASIKR